MPEKRTIEARGKRRNKNNQSSFHPLLFRAFSFDSPLLRDTVERERGFGKGLRGKTATRRWRRRRATRNGGGKGAKERWSPFKNLSARRRPKPSFRDLPFSSRRHFFLFLYSFVYRVHKRGSVFARNSGRVAGASRYGEFRRKKKTNYRGRSSQRARMTGGREERKENEAEFTTISAISTETRPCEFRYFVVVLLSPGGNFRGGKGLGTPTVSRGRGQKTNLAYLLHKAVKLSFSIAGAGVRSKLGVVNNSPPPLSVPPWLLGQNKVTLHPGTIDYAPLRFDYEPGPPSREAAPVNIITLSILYIVRLFNIGSTSVTGTLGRSVPSHQLYCYYWG